MDKIRELSRDPSIPLIFMPTHKSYLDFLLLSLICFDQQIPLPAICAGQDFLSSKILGEALRRCGAFFIKRQFKNVGFFKIF